MARSVAVLVHGASNLAAVDCRYIIPTHASVAFDIALDDGIHGGSLTTDLLVKQTAKELFLRLGPQLSEPHRYDPAC